MKCEKRRAARYANMALALYEMHVRAVKRRSGGWHLLARRMEACRRCALRSAYDVLLKKLVLFAIRKPVERCGTRGLAEKCALLGVWKPVEGMHSFRRWQKTPQWGPIAWIRERAARKRHDGAFSRADILRLSFRKKGLSRSLCKSFHRNLSILALMPSSHSSWLRTRAQPGWWHPSPHLEYSSFTRR